MKPSEDAEDQKQQFVRLVQEIDSPQVLAWCQEALARRIDEVRAERARCLHRGDVVEVTEGALAGRRGQVTARSCHARDLVLVQFEAPGFPEPLPILATALRRLAA